MCLETGFPPPGFLDPPLSSVLQSVQSVSWGIPHCLLPVTLNRGHREGPCCPISGGAAPHTDDRPWS